MTSLLDGKRTLDDIWHIACSALDEDKLTQDEILQLLGRLHTADVLYGDGAPDIEEMVERGEKQRGRKRLMSILNPLALKVPLFDPSSFLALTTPLVRPFLSIYGLIAYLALVIYGGSLVVTHWSALTENVADRVLAAESLALLLLTYPIVKAIHELGHAYTITRWGGNVHEIGLMFLVFVPVPYVDASDSLAFPSKWKRALVGAAGILVELGLAAIAMIVWVNAEPGLVRAFAFNVMLIGGVSTLFFNGNPLLRFDGYYVLSDILEIPNLGRRANQYIGYLIQRYILGIKDTENPATARGEPFWFVTYGVAAFLYRIFITTVIILLVSSMFFSLGIILAVWAVVLMFVFPLAKHLWFLVASPKLRKRRGRALAALSSVVAVIAGFVFFLPLPYATVAEGVASVPSDGAIHSETDGVVTRVMVENGAWVNAGTELLALEDPLLQARVNVLSATEAEISLRYASLNLTDPAAAKIAESELEHARADLALAREKQNAQIVRANKAGRVLFPRHSDLVGRYIPKGELLGYITTYDDLIIRTVISESNADLVRRASKDIEVAFAARPDVVCKARVAREVPALDAALPSLALATVGGGNIVLDPSDPDGRRALGRMLHLDLDLPDGCQFETIGDRIYVRFSHEPASLAQRVYRRVRQVFLRQFDI